MNPFSAQNSSNIVNSYLSGRATLDDAATEYGKQKGITSKNGRIAAFAEAVLKQPITDLSQFSKLAELEGRVYQISPSAAHKIYETSIKLLLGADRASINVVNESAKSRGITGAHPNWDKLCMWVSELISTHITKEKQPEIDSKTQKQHVVVQYLNLLSAEDQKNAAMIMFCFTLVEQPPAALFLEELAKLPPHLVPSHFGNQGKLSNYIKCGELLKKAGEDIDLKECIMTAVRILPEFSSIDYIQKTVNNLKQFNSEDRKTVIKNMEAFKENGLSLPEKAVTTIKRRIWVVGMGGSKGTENSTNHAFARATGSGTTIPTVENPETSVISSVGKKLDDFRSAYASDKDFEAFKGTMLNRIRDSSSEIKGSTTKLTLNYTDGTSSTVEFNSETQELKISSGRAKEVLINQLKRTLKPEFAEQMATRMFSAGSTQLIWKKTEKDTYQFSLQLVREITTPFTAEVVTPVTTLKPDLVLKVGTQVTGSIDPYEDKVLFEQGISLSGSADGIDNAAWGSTAKRMLYNTLYPYAEPLIPPSLQAGVSSWVQGGYQGSLAMEMTSIGFSGKEELSVGFAGQATHGGKPYPIALTWTAEKTTPDAVLQLFKNYLHK